MAYWSLGLCSLMSNYTHSCKFKFMKLSVYCSTLSVNSIIQPRPTLRVPQVMYKITNLKI